MSVSVPENTVSSLVATINDTNLGDNNGISKRFSKSSHVTAIEHPIELDQDDDIDDDNYDDTPMADAVSKESHEEEFKDTLESVATSQPEAVQIDEKKHLATDSINVNLSEKFQISTENINLPENDHDTLNKDVAKSSEPVNTAKADTNTTEKDVLDKNDNMITTKPLVSQHSLTSKPERRSSLYIKQQKEQAKRELEELRSKIHKRSESTDTDDNSSYDENQFVDILDSAFGSNLSDADKDNMDNIAKFLEEHKKIDEKLVNTKQSKFFLMKSKTKRIKKSNSVSSLNSSATGSTGVRPSLSRAASNNNATKDSLYELNNSSRATLPRIIRKISTKKSRDNASLHTGRLSHHESNGYFDNELNKPPTLNEVSSETDSNASIVESDKEVITYKKIFKGNQEIGEDELKSLKAKQKAKAVVAEVHKSTESEGAGKKAVKDKAKDNDISIMDDTEENIETFHFQFEFSKIKINEDKLKFSESITQAIQKQDFEEDELNSKSTTLISNSNGRVVTTTIKPKQSKKIFSGFGISNGIANIYSSIFGWRKHS